MWHVLHCANHKSNESAGHNTLRTSESTHPIYFRRSRMPPTSLLTIPIPIPINDRQIDKRNQLSLQSPIRFCVKTSQMMITNTLLQHTCTQFDIRSPSQQQQADKTITIPSPIAIGLAPSPLILPRRPASMVVSTQKHSWSWKTIMSCRTQSDMTSRSN